MAFGPSYFPAFLKFKEPDLLKRLYEDILYRDIASRHDIREVKALRELGIYYLSHLGSLFSYNKLKETLRLGSANTVGSYTEFFEDSYLFFTLSRFSYSLKQQYAAPKKIYGIDTGLAECMAFQFSKNRGHFLENVAYLELRRRYSELYYYQTAQGQEVDFLWRKGRQPGGLIQVTASLQNAKVRDHEVGALGQAMRELGLKQGLILTEEGEETIKIPAGTIHVRPLAQWLL